MDILIITLPGFIFSIFLIVMYEIELRKTKNNVHFYVAKDKDSTVSWLYLGKPIRSRVHGCWVPEHRTICNEDVFSDIGLNKNDYKDLTWEDEPVEVFLNLK